MEKLEGTIERITYQNEKTGYVIARLQPKHGASRLRGQSGLTTIVGKIASINPGENVVLSGFWTSHPKYGRQFKVMEYRVVYPSTTEGIRRYLGSGLIKGIGPVSAKRIVKHFGRQALDVIEHQLDRLIEVEGIGPKRVEMIRKAWEQQKQIKEVMLFLQSHNVSTAYAVKIYKHYGEDAVRVVRDNPYRLAKDVWGIGFITADKIARNLGVEEDSPQRIEAGVRYVLRQAAERGHVFLPIEKLVENSAEILKVPAELVPASIRALKESGDVIIEDNRVYLPPFFHSEAEVAKNLALLIGRPKLSPRQQWIEQQINGLEKEEGITFAPQQRMAIRKALTEPVVVITGGPGTGKTTITRAIIRLCNKTKQRLLLCAPTGRAAKRLSEITGREAKTIHRLLEFDPQKLTFNKNEFNPLAVDTLIVDEVSMIDILLMHSLLKAVPQEASLILVGDADQLPSVGAGNVLKDIIASERVEVVRLTEIFRQAQQSRIVTNAHQINQGFFPEIRNRKTGDFFFIEEENPAQVVEIIRDLCVRRLPAHYGYHPIEDIQVLSPMYRGETGAINLNRLLQQTLNPNGQSYKRGESEFRVGDKVMQIVNNYNKEVFNGDIGRIAEIDLECQTMKVGFDHLVTYDFTEIDELVLAYAISVHKSQGSEHKAVVMPIITQHYLMLQRNLLYTAVTRAKELLVLVGTKKALAIAVKNNRVIERHTWLSQRLALSNNLPHLTGFTLAGR